MTIEVKFVFENGENYYRKYSYLSGVYTSAARDDEFKILRSEAERDSVEMNAKIADISIIRG